LAFWQSRRDSGLGEALAEGFQRCTGEVLAYLNSDDLLAPNAVEEAVRFLVSHPGVVLVYGNRVCIDDKGRLLYVRPSAPFGARSPYLYMLLGQESCFWRRDAYWRAGGVNTELRFAVDYDLFSRMAKIGPVTHCDRIWGFFRKHPSSKTMTSYESIGLGEVRTIQRTVWGAEIPQKCTALIATLYRLYAGIYGSYIERARWPGGVPKPPVAPWRTRVSASVRHEHFLRRTAAWLLCS
jgi:glycosyltransferase involved in cell wall biosynthesis